MATIIPHKPSKGSLILINVENQRDKRQTHNTFYYKVQMENENFLEVVKKKYPNRNFNISNVKVDGKRVAGSNPPFINRDGVYVFPCVEN